MRKYVLGIAVAVVFVFYSIVVRSQHSEPVIAPISLSQSNTSNTTAPAASGSQSASTPTAAATTSSQYKDGTYSGSVENAFYGNVQISVVIQSGKITAVKFLQSPDQDPNSVNVNEQAIPYLQQEAIKAQSSHVSIVTGATDTSQAFTKSLATALSQASQS